MICAGNWLLIEAEKRKLGEGVDDAERKKREEGDDDSGESSVDDDSSESVDYSKMPPLRRIRPDYIRPDADESVIEFDHVYEENKSVLLMPANKSYPINRSAVADWVASLQETGAPSAVVEFAQVFQANARHIPFSEFYEELVTLARSLSFKCQQEQSVIWLSRGQFVSKSNYWVCLMIWPYIREHVVRVNEGFTLNEKFYTQFPRVRYVFADDASYSGSQATNGIGFNRYLWHIDVPGTVCVLVPYITKVAQNLIESRHRIPSIMTIEILYAVKLPVLSDLFPVEKLEEVKKYPGFAVLGETQTMVYFDHKMPDSVSNADLMFLFAPTYVRSEKRFVTRSLISSCKIEFKDKVSLSGWVTKAPRYPEDKDKFIYDILMNASVRRPTEYDFIPICPPAFQKTLKYNLAN